MTPSDILTAIGLPAESLVGQRVPKKLLIENGAPTAADRRQIADGIEVLHWEASLKPTTIGVPAYRDTIREYLEIAVLTMILRAEARANRLFELVHRAVPYPTLLLSQDAQGVTISLAHKRWSQGEVGKIVLDGDVIAVTLTDDLDDMHTQFMPALALARQPQITMQTLYQGWIDVCQTLLVARITGAFALADSADRAAERRQALQACAELQTQIARLRAAAKKEKQLARRVDLNLELGQLRAALAAARAKL